MSERFVRLQPVEEWNAKPQSKRYVPYALRPRTTSFAEDLQGVRDGIVLSGADHEALVANVSVRNRADSDYPAV